jgi:hypothetical protein
MQPIGASISIIAASDPDTMYFHQAMKQDDATEFLKAAHKEFQSLLDREVIEINPRLSSPKRHATFLSRVVNEA